MIFKDFPAPVLFSSTFKDAWEPSPVARQIPALRLSLLSHHHHMPYDVSQLNEALSAICTWSVDSD